MRITDSLDTSPNYIYRCGTTSGDVIVLVTPTNEAAVIQTSPTAGSNKAPSVLRTTAAVSNTQMASPGSSEPTSNIASEPSTSSNTSGTSTTSSGSMWKYAVIGVGGVVVILTLIAVIFCLWRRTRKLKKVKEVGIGYNMGNMQYMGTDTSSVGDPAEIAKRNQSTGRWVHSAGPPGPGLDGETLVNGSSRGRV